VVRTIEPHSEADPALLLVHLVVAFGNAVGRAPGFRVEGDFHGTNLYALAVGETSKGRKGVAKGQANRFMGLVDPDWAKECVVSGISTGEGLIHHVRDPVTLRRQARTEEEKARADEDGYILEEVDSGVADKRLMVVEGEFAQVLKVMAREGNIVSPVIRDLWDSGTARTLTKYNPSRTTNAHVSIVGHITTTEFRRGLTTTEAANGFANRFLFVCARRSKSLPHGGSLTDQDLEPLAGQLRVSLAAARERGVLGLDPEARKVWEAEYDALADGHDGLLGATTGRAEAQVRRLAVTYALADGADIVSAHHLGAALALWDYSARSARYVFGGKLGDGLADRLHAALKDAGAAGLSRSQVRDKVLRTHAVEKKHIAQALAALQVRGLAHMRKENTGGRPTERWYAAGGHPLGEKGGAVGEKCVPEGEGVRPERLSAYEPPLVAYPPTDSQGDPEDPTTVDVDPTTLNLELTDEDSLDERWGYATEEDLDRDDDEFALANGYHPDLPPWAGGPPWRPYRGG
jgi:hypothetical protein